MARILAIAAFLLVAAPASAQTATAYPVIVDQYIAGDASGAVRQLAPTSARLSGEIVARAKQFPDRQVRAAVMMHTELAAAWLAAGQPGEASTQLGNAERLLGLLTGDVRRRPPSQTFAIRWYAFTARLYAAQGLYDQAYRTVRDGLSVFPGAAELYVADGAIYEAGAGLLHSSRNDRHVRDVGRDRRQYASLLESAAKCFRRALEIDATLATAHLHRGWVHHLLEDPKAALDFEAALEHARDDGSRYLAHLFLGAAAERRKDLEAARRHYAAAMAVAPYQSAYVGLSRIEEESGHHDRARALAAEYAGLPEDLEDPWWDYRLGGSITGALGWLRDEARRP